MQSISATLFVSQIASFKLLCGAVPAFGHSIQYINLLFRTDKSRRHWKVISGANAFGGHPHVASQMQDVSPLQYSPGS